jgi:hypothetical protein
MVRRCAFQTVVHKHNKSLLLLSCNVTNDQPLAGKEDLPLSQFTGHLASHFEEKKAPSSNGWGVQDGATKFMGCESNRPFNCYINMTKKSPKGTSRGVLLSFFTGDLSDFYSQAM